MDEPDGSVVGVRQVCPSTGPPQHVESSVALGLGSRIRVALWAAQLNDGQVRIIGRRALRGAATVRHALLLPRVQSGAAGCEGAAPWSTRCQASV